MGQPKKLTFAQKAYKKANDGFDGLRKDVRDLRIGMRTADVDDLWWYEQELWRVHRELQQQFSRHPEVHIEQQRIRMLACELQGVRQFKRV